MEKERALYGALIGKRSSLLKKRAENIPDQIISMSMEAVKSVVTLSIFRRLILTELLFICRSSKEKIYIGK